MGDYRPKIEQRLLHELMLIVGLLGITLFQTALSPTLWSLRIDWVLVVVVCITLLRGFAVGLHWALIGGLALDLLSPLPIGAHLLGLLLAVTVVAVSTDALPRTNRLVPTGAVLLVSLLYTALLGVIMMATGRPVVWAYYPFTIVLPGALANGVVTLPTYQVLEWLRRERRHDIGLEV